MGPARITVQPVPLASGLTHQYIIDALELGERPARCLLIEAAWAPPPWLTALGKGKADAEETAEKTAG